MPTPEEKARQIIDQLLTSAGWTIQDRAEANLDVAGGVAIREFPLGYGFGEADYMLIADGRALGAVEAKKEGSTLTGFEGQTNPPAWNFGSRTFWSRMRLAAPSSASIRLRRFLAGLMRN
ncbi:MAG TPA: hypothetical protein VGT04_00470 [Acidobacteriaceae bacterium]|nr:hypothetical protein [Acidobacteriaceae bacterium]